MAKIKLKKYRTYIYGTYGSDLDTVPTTDIEIECSDEKLMIIWEELKAAGFVEVEKRDAH